MKLSIASPKFYLMSLFLLIVFSSFGQSLQKEKMAQLSFMVGDWVGSSKSYKDGVLQKDEPAFQKINYDLNKHIIVINLRSESLQLHTVIYYDKEDETYYYTPFSERGSTRLKAELLEGKLIVNSNETTRYVFNSTENDGFQEYGEKLIDGEWVRYFQDDFINTQEKE